MDHHPLILSVPMNLERYSKPFQFFNFMTEIPGFKDAVSKAWSSTWYGNPMNILCRKLKLVKRELVKLNKDHGNFQNNVNTARSRLHILQEQLTLMPLDQTFIAEELLASKALEQALMEEESLLLQKSRTKWLSLGDGNNSFFFNQTKANWNKNKIMALENSEGKVVFGHQAISQVAVDFFKGSLGTPPEVIHFDLNDIDCATLSNSHIYSLELPVTSDLILQTLKAMKRNKVPDPDGFTVEFFLSVWDIVGLDFTNAITSFFNTTIMHLEMNSTSIALVPKVNTPTHMKDFRPISLCSIAYKCIAKILANRIKLVLPGIIDISQSAFIPRRSISDNILMAQ